MLFHEDVILLKNTISLLYEMLKSAKQKTTKHDFAMFSLTYGYE